MENAIICAGRDFAGSVSGSSAFLCIVKRVYWSEVCLQCDIASALGGLRGL